MDLTEMLDIILMGVVISGSLVVVMRMIRSSFGSIYLVFPGRFPFPSSFRYSPIPPHGFTKDGHPWFALSDIRSYRDDLNLRFVPARFGVDGKDLGERREEIWVNCMEGRVDLEVAALPLPSDRLVVNKWGSLRKGFGWQKADHVTLVVSCDEVAKAWKDKIQQIRGEYLLKSIEKQTARKGILPHD